MIGELRFGVAIVVFAAGCNAPSDGGPPFGPREMEVLRSLSPLGSMPGAPGNAFADDPRAADLGERLFFDAGLSEAGRVSCATCHAPERWFADGRPRSIGLSEGARNAPSLLGAPWAPFLSWDGRKDSVWSQALGAIEAVDEHGFTRLGVAHRIARAHRRAYEAAFGVLPDLSDRTRFPQQGRPVPGDDRHPHDVAWTRMTPSDRGAIDRIFVHAGKSIEAYLRRFEPGPAPFDRYVAALDEGDPSGGGHLSAGAVRGLRAFIGDGRCVLCHHGPLLSDHEFHNVGPPPAFGAPEADPGWEVGAAAAQRDPFRCGSRASDADDCPALRFLPARTTDRLGAFRTPSLRDVAETAPYMHGGQLAKLEDVIDFYRTLPGEPAVGRRDPLLERLDRSVATDDLLAFLHALTGPAPVAGPPR